MTISSIGNSHISTQFQTPQNASRSGEAGEVGPDVDGDADDGGRKAVPASAAPTVNSSGQTVGQLINVKA
ncbi:MAG: hypothetical protein P4L40_04510 [Terracidiphilus sp.]|jgi:hypothetical protein|nr:hypothetical protein [Terracidiphilus sp.]